VKRVAAKIWGAHAPRVRARRLAEQTFPLIGHHRCAEDGFGEAPKPAREARALPGICGFTIVELLIVMAIILALAGLILATSSYVQKKGQRSRAEAEIAAMSAALENYKADNGTYPRDASTTDILDARTHLNSDPQNGDPEYRQASTYLFTQLSGMNPDQTPIVGAKSYFTFRPQLLGGTTNGWGTVLYLRDPFGNCYGYSTAEQANSSHGYNPTFDLWSTANETDSTRWIKNW
jgi:prepilin-type N-terminal cleavage/methylation domain-containing protein